MEQLAILMEKKPEFRFDKPRNPTYQAGENPSKDKSLRCKSYTKSSPKPAVGDLSIDIFFDLSNQYRSTIDPHPVLGLNNTEANDNFKNRRARISHDDLQITAQYRMRS